MIKKIKIISTAAMLAIALAMTAGCSADPVADDISDYLNSQLPTVQTMENTLKETFSAAVEKDDTDDAALLIELNEVIIPASSTLVAAAKIIVPDTEELAAVHEQYITALTTQNSGFVMLAEGLAGNSSADKAAEANELLEAAQTQGDDFLTALSVLAKDHGIDINGDE